MSNHTAIFITDLCIIGGGAAGVSLARNAKQCGMDIILIEQNQTGGTYLHQGCIPAHILKSCAQTAHNIRTSEEYAVRSQDPKIDIQDIHKHIQKIIQRIQPHDSIERLEGFGIRVIKAQARFKNSQELSITNENGDTATIKSKHFVIATGSSHTHPSISGLDESKILTRINLEEKPKELIIIGGSKHAVELAQSYQRLGIQITLIEKNTILEEFDSDDAEIIRKTITQEGVKLLENTDIQSVAHLSDNEVILNVDNDGYERSIKGSHIIALTKRTPNIQTLNLASANIDHTSTGITVNETLRTNQKNIWAIGDVTNTNNKSTATAIHHTSIVTKNICLKQKEKAQINTIPRILNTAPEIAEIGLTGQQAIDKYGHKNIKIFQSNLKDNDFASINNINKGHIRVITNNRGKILGTTIVASNATELITPWTLAIQQNLNIKDMNNIITPYPSLSESHKRTAGKYFFLKKLD